MWCSIYSLIFQPLTQTIEVTEIEEKNCTYSRRQYKVSVPLKKNRCPTAYQRFKKRNRLPFLRRLYDHNFYAPFSV